MDVKFSFAEEGGSKRGLSRRKQMLGARHRVAFHRRHRGLLSPYWCCALTSCAVHLHPPAARPGCEREEDLRGPGPEHLGASVSGEVRGDPSEAVQAEPGD